MHLTHTPLARVFCLLLLSFAACAARADDYCPEIHGPSNEGELAIGQFRIPEGYRLELVAAEPDLANPVAFCIDEQGRFYVCETFRQGKGVEDNRNHMNWLERDLSLQTVEERVEMFREFLGDEAEGFRREHDRIRLLADTDGDGVVDQSTVFADGFNEIEDGTGSGVLAYHGDVYYTCIPHLWRLRDTNDDGVADERTSLAEGFGVRVAFRGHDLHGLTWGPDGRIYFSQGDRGFNVTTLDGETLKQPDTGAVFRCWPDGTGMEVFATGLRNPQEIAFDDYGNLFTCDNNSDSGDQAKWYHILEGSDAGWRMYYQYLDDRGPWNRERMWHPYQNDEETTRNQPAYINPPRLNISDGPSGLVYYPGVGLPDEYNGHFFLVDFRGGAGNSGIRSFAMEPNGATFDLVDSEEFLWSILASDVDFGWDGNMYILDWVDGWNGPGKGRIYRLVHEATENDAVRDETVRMMAEGMDGLEMHELLNLLGHPDRRVRLEAQFALVRQNDIETNGALLQLAAGGENEIARLHALWGLGQLVRIDRVYAHNVARFLNDDSEELQAQAALILGDVQFDEAVPRLIDLLSSTPSARVKYHCAMALGKIGDPSALPAIITLLETNNDADPALRHAGICGLAGCATAADDLVALSTHDSRAVRVAAIVALLRLHHPHVAAFLDDAEPQVVEEAARAIHDLPIADALPSLAALAARPGMSDALARRVMNANFRLGSAGNAAAVAAMAASSDWPEHLRVEAIRELRAWGEPPVLDRVTNEFRPVGARDKSVAEAAIRANLGGILSGPESVRREGITLAADYGIDEIGPLLTEFVLDFEQPTSVRVASLEGMSSLRGVDLDDILNRTLDDDDPAVRSTALSLLAQRSPAEAVPRLSAVIADGTQAERQSAVSVLAGMNRGDADAVLQEWLNKLNAGEAPAEIHLDLLTAAETRATADMLAHREAYEAARPSDNPLGPWLECLEGGDTENGREVFFGSAAASCRRCHIVDGSGGNVGPNLSSIGLQKPLEYLLEAIVLPNAKIAKGFESVLLAMDDGRVITGIVRGEDEHTYRIVVGTGEVIVVEKSHIEEQAVGRSGMPDDAWKQLTRSDIRDLVAYLASLRAPPDEEPL